MPHFRKEIQYLLLILLVITACSALPQTAHAQRKNISAREMGILTFYKLSGMKPDFYEWINQNPAYVNMSKTDKLEANIFREEEVLRLQWGLGTLNPETNFMHISTEIIGTLLHSKGKDYLGVTFTGKRERGEPYFPYSIGKLSVAVIMKDIKNFMVLELSPDSLAKIKGYMPANTKYAKLNLRITYRGISAETTPIKLDGVNQYTMLGEIAHWEVFLPQSGNSELVSIWEYMEPWYRTEEEDDLIRMLEGEE